jgi:hypothetical protein
VHAEHSKGTKVTNEFPCGNLTFFKPISDVGLNVRVNIFFDDRCHRAIFATGVMVEGK